MRGTIRKRAQSSWTIILDIGRDPATGKRRQQWISVRGTKRDAEKRLAEVVNQVDNGAFVKPAKTTISDFFDNWLTSYAELNVRERTLARLPQFHM